MELSDIITKIKEIEEALRALRADIEPEKK